jgi:hypothetical protein
VKVIGRDSVVVLADAGAGALWAASGTPLPKSIRAAAVVGILVRMVIILS